MLYACASLRIPIAAPNASVSGCAWGVIYTFLQSSNKRSSLSVFVLVVILVLFSAVFVLPPKYFKSLPSMFTTIWSPPRDKARSRASWAISPNLLSLILLHAIPPLNVTKISYSREISAILSSILNSFLTRFNKFSLFITAINFEFVNGVM